MQAHRLPAARGWSWIVEGFRLFRRNPPLLTFLVFGYWMLLVLINVVPLIGPIVASLCVPALSVSVMNGCRSIDRGEPVQIGLLVSGFQRKLPRLLTLGGLYFAASIAVLAVSAMVDGGTLMQAMVSGKADDAEALHNTNLMLALQTALLLMVPVLMAFWFAPLLAAWDGAGVAKSLFFSLVASWRNWRAFLVYGFGVAFFSAILPGIVLGAFAAFSKTLLNIMVVALTLPLLFVFVPTLFASFYVSYCDVFSAAPVDRSAGGNTDVTAR